MNVSGCKESVESWSCTIEMWVAVQVKVRGAIQEEDGAFQSVSQKVP